LFRKALKKLWQYIGGGMIILMLLPKIMKESWKLAKAQARVDIEMAKRYRESLEQEKKKKSAKVVT